MSESVETRAVDDEEIDELLVAPEQMAAVIARLRAEQRLGAAAIAGVVACLVGAVLWATVTAVTRLQIGWMAVGVGALVGFSIRRVGRGVEARFGYLGAALALAGCVLGNVLAVYIMAAVELDLTFAEAVTEISPGVVIRLLVATFGVYDLLFYGLAIYEGYRLAFRDVTGADLLLQPEVAVAAGEPGGSSPADSPREGMIAPVSLPR